MCSKSHTASVAYKIADGSPKKHLPRAKGEKRYVAGPRLSVYAHD